MYFFYKIKKNLPLLEKKTEIWKKKAIIKIITINIAIKSKTQIE